MKNSINKFIRNITSTNIIIERIIKHLSVIVLELSILTTSNIFSFVVFKFFLNTKVKNAITTVRIIAMKGVNTFTKSIKDKPAALPIIIFGGSPIKVAVPPILDANTSPNSNGIICYKIVC